VGGRSKIHGTKYRTSVEPETENPAEPAAGTENPSTRYLVIGNGVENIFYINLYKTMSP